MTAVSDTDPIQSTEMAINAVIANIDAVEKLGKNTHFGFQYQKWDDIQPAVAQALTSVGLVITSQPTDIRYYEALSSKGQPFMKAVVTMEFTLRYKLCEPIVRIWWGEANDQDDKTIQKAITSATKYFLQKTFWISSKDSIDPDDDGPAQSVQRTTEVKPGFYLSRTKSKGSIVSTEEHRDATGFMKAETDIDSHDALNRLKRAANAIDLDYRHLLLEAKLVGLKTLDQITAFVGYVEQDERDPFEDTNVNTHAGTAKVTANVEPKNPNKPDGFIYGYKCKSKVHKEGKQQPMTIGQSNLLKGKLALRNIDVEDWSNAIVYVILNEAFGEPVECTNLTSSYVIEFLTNATDEQFDLAFAAADARVAQKALL